MRPWSKLPSWWFRPGQEALISLEGGQQAGTSQAALRVYLGLAAVERTNAASFDVQASFSDLEDMTRLSRVMVQRGIKRAVEAGLITYQPGGRRTRSTFALVRPDEEGPGGWAKLPRREVQERLPRLPHRGASALVALKLYLILLAGRPNDNTVVALKHVTLREKSGAQTNQIRTGISLLANEGLIHVIAETGEGYEVQKYHLVGRLDAPRQWATATPVNSDMLADQLSKGLSGT